MIQVLKRLSITHTSGIWRISGESFNLCEKGILISLFLGEEVNMRKKVYMWQPNYIYGKDAYLPYSVGALAAYAWSDIYIQTHYELTGLFYSRMPIEQVAVSLQNPFICAFSCYTWNFEYNKALAKRIKELYPTCFVVFGGHQISLDLVVREAESEMFYVDYFIYDEGEIAFAELLKALSQESDLRDISNISFRDTTGENIFTKRQMVSDTDFPSPYLEGIFDKIFTGSHYSFSATLETNRGCPYSCGYCDWGIYKAKIRRFPMERIKAEIDWFATHQIDLVFGADSNFGIFDRDEEIADYLVFKNKQCGFPKKFRVSYAKNSDERVFRINKNLNDQGMAKGATLSFQSLDTKTLENIGRKNISTESFTKLLNLYHKEKIPTYSEIILGLPGETAESFRKGLAKLITGGQHSSINVYLWEMLPNSALAQKKNLELFEIQTLKTPLNQYHCAPLENDVQEFSHIVIANSTMPVEDWKESYLFAWMVQCFHLLGLTRCISIFLFFEKGIGYDYFYKDFQEFLQKHPETVAGSAYTKTRKILDDVLEEVPGSAFTYYDAIFGGILWPPEEGGYLEILRDVDKFYQEIESFLKKFQIDELLFQDLLQYQRNVIRKPFDKEHTITLQYNLCEYFEHNISGGGYAVPVKKEKCTFTVRGKKIYERWDEFAREVVWYGRKGGDTLYQRVSGSDLYQ